jgi:hypothetical protein
MATASFTEFDPLDLKASQSEAAIHALKREIRNILSSYVGWYDPFAELIQNALDSVEQKLRLEVEQKGEKTTYVPQIRIIINIRDNTLTVTDNGVGLTKEQFQQFLTPNFSFKSGPTRGHKGVGATYIAYGFNYMQVATRTGQFQAIGCITNARKWLDDPAPSGNPKMSPDSNPPDDPDFTLFESGVSVTVKFDDTTYPKRLDWIQASTASSWMKILSIKTGLGAIFPNPRIHVDLRVINDKGIIEDKSALGIAYYWIHNDFAKKASCRDILNIERQLFDKHGAGFRHPDKINNLDIVFEQWSSDEVVALLGPNVEPDEKRIFESQRPSVGVEYGYTAKLWQKFNDDLGVRQSYRVMNSGIQMAANNMPQGETIQVPLTRNIGRQNQLHFVFHFDNYTPDLGRKGFHKELTDFAKEISRKLMDHHLVKVRARLKANTGVAPDLLREQQISQWKKEMEQHEKVAPLAIENRNFFLPTNRISITSTPTREQDVIALFHQLIAGGVIRGVRAMSTNERLTYDGLFRIAFDLEPKHYVYEKSANPLGISQPVADQLKGILTEPKVLEYKYSLDGLVEDMDVGEKNIKDISLAIVWETGDLYKERYGITSLLIPENMDQRQFHGVSHHLCDSESGTKLMDIIVLKELIDYLNNPDETAAGQRTKYA